MLSILFWFIRSVSTVQSVLVFAATNQENRRSLLAVKKEKKERKQKKVKKEKVEKKDDGVNQGSSAANQGDDVGENNQAASGARTFVFVLEKQFPLAFNR
jgi:hypothetical protein